MMQRAVNLAPDNATYRQTLARFYEQNGDRDKAVKIYRRLTSRQANDPDAFYQLGTYAEQQGQLTRAVAYYRRALHLHPGHAPSQKALELALQQAAEVLSRNNLPR
jgi:tetratricopeptide (TPR) repeat protein